MSTQWFTLKYFAILQRNLSYPALTWSGISLVLVIGSTPMVHALIGLLKLGIEKPLEGIVKFTLWEAQ